MELLREEEGEKSDKREVEKERVRKSRVGKKGGAQCHIPQQSEGHEEHVSRASQCKSPHTPARND